MPTCSTFEGAPRGARYRCRRGSVGHWLRRRRGLAAAVGRPRAGAGSPSAPRRSLWPGIIPLPYGEPSGPCGSSGPCSRAGSIGGRAARSAARALARRRSASSSGLWELATAKTGYLPLPFFPPPQALIEVYVEDWPRLLDSLRASAGSSSGVIAFGAAPAS